MSIKQNILDTLNAGIGAVKSLEEQIKKRRDELQKNFDSLAKKGSEDSSEVSEKARKLIADFLDSTKEIGDNLEKTKEDVKEKFSNILNVLPGNFTKTREDDNEATAETESDTKKTATTSGKSNSSSTSATPSKKSSK